MSNIKSKIQRTCINLPVKNVEKAKDFYLALGFEIDPNFSNKDHVASIILADNLYLMLLCYDFIKMFIPDNTLDFSKTLKAVNSFQLADPKKVDNLYNKAIATGGRKITDAVDNEYMYYQSVYDLDGHFWQFYCFKQ